MDSIKTLLQKYGVRPSKKRGQSFLTDSSIARKIVEVAGVRSDEAVLEIGGGLGILTTALAEFAGHVTVIEIEPGLIRALSDSLSRYDNVEIIQGDALSVDLPQVSKVVSNLPYSISSDITFRILEEVKPERAVLMYQQEFAERLLAKPGTGTYSRLTIDATYLAEIKGVLHVPASVFYPVPAVDSTVVVMAPRMDGPRARDDNIFKWLIRGIYSYPNKKLRKALIFWLRTLKREKTLSQEIIQRSQLDSDARLRTLTLDSLVVLADTVLELVDEGLLPDLRGS